MEGWVKLHRSLLDWQWYSDYKTCHLYIHLLLTANHKDGNWRGQKVNRGQLISGRKSLSEKTGLSEGSIRTCLSKLKSTNDITIKPTNKNSVYTVVNYDLYQNQEMLSQQDNQQLTNKQPLNSQQLATNKNDNNNKNEKNDKKFNFKDSLLTLCNDEQVVDDYILLRKNKRATNSKTSFNGLRTEFDKTTLSVKDVLTICIEKDWKGFKAEWLENSSIQKEKMIYFKIDFDKDGVYRELPESEFNKKYSDHLERIEVFPKPSYSKLIR